MSIKKDRRGRSKLVGYLGQRRIKTKNMSDDEIINTAREIYDIPKFHVTFSDCVSYIQFLKNHNWVDERGSPITYEWNGRSAKKQRSHDHISDFYKSWDWKRLRYDFLKERQRRCQCCGATPESGAKIVIDHIKPIRKHWHLRLDRANLQILCDDCNMGKGSRDETDWSNVVAFKK